VILALPRALLPTIRNCFLLRTEPSFALAWLDGGLVVKRATRHVIDFVTTCADITFD
jgi:hypothetical protein